MIPAVERRTILWTLVLFFGASIIFSAIKNATEDESIAVTLGLELVALAAMVGVIVVVVRRGQR